MTDAEIKAHVDAFARAVAAIGGVFAQQHGTAKCPECGHTLHWSASFRLLSFDCDGPNCFRDARLHGRFKLERHTPEYRQGRLL